MRLTGVLDLPATATDPGPPIVIVPGWGEGLWGWKQPSGHLARLTGRRVIVITAPGWRHLVTRASSLDRIARHVSATLRRRGVTGAVGLGHSMGGYCVTRVASTNPGLISRLILVCPAGLMDHDHFVLLQVRLLKKAILSLWHAIRQPRLLRGTLVALAEGLTYLARNPWGVAEGLSLTNVKLAETLPPRTPYLVLLAKIDYIYPRRRLVLPPGVASHTLPGYHDPQYDPAAFAVTINDILR